MEWISVDNKLPEHGHQADWVAACKEGFGSAARATAFRFYLSALSVIFVMFFFFDYLNGILIICFFCSITFCVEIYV